MAGFDGARVARTTAIVLLVGGLALLTVVMADVFLLIFGAILIAALIRSAAIPFLRMGLPDSLSVLLGLAAIVLALVLAGWLFGATLGAQFAIVAGRLPGAAEQARAWIGQFPLMAPLLSTTPDVQAIMGQAMSVAFGALGALTNLVLVFIAAVYLALQPQLYARGIELLFPKDEGPRVRDALTTSGLAMRRYLLAQFVTMTAVGLVVGIGLAVLGVPSAAALGLIVGLANFIPLIGPFIGAVPGVLIAFAVDTQTGVWAALVYFVAQQLEGNVLTPLVQRYAVSIPPAVLLFSLAALGGLFGAIGVVLAAPLAVVVYTLTYTLWVRGALGHDVPPLTPAGPAED
jgi:predicted PurR-regulated permease PerM